MAVAVLLLALVCNNAVDGLGIVPVLGPLQRRASTLVHVGRICVALQENFRHADLTIHHANHQWREAILVRAVDVRTAAQDSLYEPGRGDEER